MRLAIATFAASLLATAAWAQPLPEPTSYPPVVGEKGVVRDPALHAEVCEMISAWMNAQAGWKVVGIEKSPITGPEGNVEFLLGALQL